MEHIDLSRMTGLTVYRIPIVLGLIAFAALGMVYGGGFSSTDAPVQVQGQPQLIASANDPIMIDAIRYARAHSKGESGGSPWSKPRTGGDSATFTTPAGSITLSRDEIENANFIYPQLAERARNGSRTEFGQAPDAGFDEND